MKAGAVAGFIAGGLVLYLIFANRSQAAQGGGQGGGGTGGGYGTGGGGSPYGNAMRQIGQGGSPGGGTGGSPGGGTQMAYNTAGTGTGTSGTG